jgi:putative ABC transport system permease protein
LFPDEDPLGQEVRVNRVRFEVIGLIKTIDITDPRVDPNNTVILPISTAVSDLFGKDRSVSVRVKVRDEKQITAATDAIKSYFREAHNTPENQQEDVEVFSMSQITQAQSAPAFASASFRLRGGYSYELRARRQGRILSIWGRRIATISCCAQSRS